MLRIPTISEINELNRRYWEEQIPLSNRRIADGDSADGGGGWG
jgi:hypothetical protein